MLCLGMQSRDGNFSSFSALVCGGVKCLWECEVYVLCAYYTSLLWTGRFGEAAVSNVAMIACALLLSFFSSFFFLRFGAPSVSKRHRAIIPHFESVVHCESVLFG